MGCRPKNRGSVLGRGKKLSSSDHPDRLWGPPSLLIHGCTVGHCPRMLLQLTNRLKTLKQPKIWTSKHVSFLKIKPTRCTNFSNLFLEWKSTCFGQFLCPSSGVFHCTHSNGICHTGLLTASVLLLLASCQQTCMTYTIAVCTVKNSWRWTEELSETCRVTFQE